MRAQLALMTSDLAIVEGLPIFSNRAQVEVVRQLNPHHALKTATF
jgi:hypothetical protein